MKRKQWKKISVIISFLAMVALALSGCSGGSDGAAGAPGATGPAGTTGPAGPSGANAKIADFHGTAVVTAEDELQGAPANPKFLANIAITGATADAAGLATVTFTVKKKDNATPVTGLTTVSAGIFKLAPKATGPELQPVGPLHLPHRPDGERRLPGEHRHRRRQPRRQRRRQLHLHLRHQPLDGDSPLPHRRREPGRLRPRPHPPRQRLRRRPRRPHRRGRLRLRAGRCRRHSRPATSSRPRPARSATVPNSPATAATASRWKAATPATARTAAMVNTAANGGTTETIEMAVMIHKIHAGRELASAPGPDGIFFDDPATAADEAADNGKYTRGQPQRDLAIGRLPGRACQLPGVPHQGSGARRRQLEDRPLPRGLRFLP